MKQEPSGASPRGNPPDSPVGRKVNIADEWNKARGLLGQEVRIMLDLEDENAVAEGQLLSVDEGGGFVVLDDMGFKHYCWPLLKVAEP